MKFPNPKIIFIFLIILFFSILPSCNKEDRIPYVPVNFTLYLTMPEFNSLKTPGNYLYLTGGVKGIVVYCEYADEYNAYERNCPYNPYDADAILQVDSTGLFLECLACGSKFSLYDGSLVQGPSKYSVLQYTTYLENDALYVYTEY